MATGPYQSEREALEVVRRVLVDAGLTPQPIADPAGFSADFKDDGLPVTGTAIVLHGQDRFVFYLEFDGAADPALLPQVAEYITRANCGIDIGNFELDYDDGAVRYKTSLDYEGDRLRANYVQNAVTAATDGVRVYAAGLAEVRSGKKSAADAVAEAEATLVEE